MIKRPLLWLGIAYIAGILIRILDLPLCGLLIVGIEMILGIIAYHLKTDRIYQKSTEIRFLVILSVFLLSGFVRTCQAMIVPEMDACIDEQCEVVFDGIVENIEAKEHSDLVLLTKVSARVCGVESGCPLNYLICYTTSGEGSGLSVGDHVSGSGTMRRFESATVPGQFDAKAYYLARGIWYQVKVKDMTRESADNSLEVMLLKLRGRLLGSYRDILRQKDAGIMDAMVLGDRSLLEDDLMTLYREMGIIHILCISGCHISLVGMLIYRFFTNLGMGRWAALASIWVVIAFGVLVGAGFPTQRAIIMFILRMASVFLEFNYDSLSALGLSALILFGRQPLMVTQTGPQFSCLAVLGTALLWQSARELLGFDEMDREGRRARHFRIKAIKAASRNSLQTKLKIWIMDVKDKPLMHKKLLKALGPAVCIMLCTMPVTAVNYGSIAPVSLLLNLMILPLMSLLLPIGLTAGVCGLICRPFAAFLGGSIHAILAFYEWLCLLAKKLPLASYITGCPPMWVIVTYYSALILFVVMVRVGGVKKKQWLSLLLVTMILLIPVRRMQPFVAFLDVGQGDCALLRTDSGKTWMIDGGSSSVKDVGHYRIEPFMAYMGIDKVDYALLSHPDEDHYSGIRELMESGKIGHLVVTRTENACVRVMEVVEDAGKACVSVTRVGAGDTWVDGKWHFECLFPDEVEADADLNDTSMVILADSGDKTFLFTGDISQNAEEKICRQYKGKSIDVLKVAHHGSSTGTGETFLKHFRVQTAVISCGLHNRYGHPHEETIERLKAHGCKIISTQDNGTIFVE